MLELEYTKSKQDRRVNYLLSDEARNTLLKFLTLNYCLSIERTIFFEEKV